jgi:hypothetical protein
MSKDTRFHYSQRDPASGVSLILDLPDPSRIKNNKMKAAIVELRSQEAKQVRREDALKALLNEVNQTERVVESEAAKALNGDKNAHKEAVARAAELKDEAQAALDLQPRSEAKVKTAAGDVLIAWKNERKSWSRDLETEAREQAAELATLKLSLDRLVEGFDATLGVLAGYARYDADARHRGSIAAHAISFDLDAASEAMRAALIKLDERGY